MNSKDINNNTPRNDCKKTPITKGILKGSSKLIIY